MNPDNFSSLIKQLKVRCCDPLRATDGALIITPKVYPLASEVTVTAAETSLGFALPSLLRHIYLEVGNGGFGPGYGLFGVEGGATNDQYHTVVELYHNFRQPRTDDPAWQWPLRLLPICHLGCGMYAGVNCSNAQGTITWYEPNPRELGDPMDMFLIPAAPSLADWLWAWLRNEDWMLPAYNQSALKRWQDNNYGQA